ncbi:hypothetical protein BCR39DRAFT_519226 [Naematelia encephala]|uniref:Kinetochore protein Sos7 coiled-coil domain-containing protein n=1 Tax=Naematelia encephala TaxID=71784 RepID=A0A1Y2BI62_9TREE|nr:hypothetical protein BCR39DRAFT_519226 [Naematelia encephala]
MASPTASTTIHSSSSTLHQSIDHLITTSQQPLNLLQHREKFQERALRDVTTNSNDSAMMLDPNNPVLVREEMAAQKEYFRRLKFNYLEQEAKRKFLVSITGDEPQGVQPGENEEREMINREKKARLKAAKAELDSMRSEAIDLATANATKHAALAGELAEAQAIQKQVRDMELELARIKATHPPEERMTTARAYDTLDSQTEEMQKLTEAISTTATRADTAREQVAKGLKEVKRLEREREREEARAKEVREGREAGDTRVDELCRWLTSSMAMYRGLLGIKSIKAISDTVLQITYGVSSKQEVTLELEFDPSTKRFLDANLIGSDLDIVEAAGIAQASGDVPGLIADVLVRLRPIA